MIKAVTIGIPHDAKAKPRVITGPDVPLTDQIQGLKKLGTERVNKEFARVEVWTSNSGVSNVRKFLAPTEADRREKAADAQDKAAAKVAPKK